MRTRRLTAEPLPVVLLRGGGDLASGVTLRLHRAGINVLITELAQPLTVRRSVAFSSAVFEGVTRVEGVTARLVSNPAAASSLLSAGEVPVFVDPDCNLCDSDTFRFVTLVDARMTKKPPDLGLGAAPLVVGLGPGFVAGENCHAAIETNRGHYLGRVLWDGSPEPNTGVPGEVGQHRHDRVLRAPADGALETDAQIGDRIAAGQRIASVSGHLVTAPFEGILRGLIYPGLTVRQGTKIGDLDPRLDPRLTETVSEKALAIGGGVLEALLTKPEIRTALWN